MITQITTSELENIGHALSTLIQQRYVWLFNHISRAIFLQVLDNSVDSLPTQYYFSLEDQQKGCKPIETSFIIDLLSRRCNKSFAFSEDPENPVSYNYEFVRKITTDGIRGAFLTSVQTYLEYYTILKIFKDHSLPEQKLFDFIRQARNIICHSNGIMDSSRIRRCQWKHITIEKNNKQLKMTDQELLTLVEEAIVVLATLYSANNRDIDYVSLNLGYSIPFIQKYIIEHKK